MGAIDVGYPPADMALAAVTNYTYINKENPANDTGILSSVELWFATDGSGVVVATFSGSALDWTSRDSANIGNVTSGSKQTFSGLSIDVATNDLIGFYSSGGTIEQEEGSSVGRLYKSGNQITGSAVTFSDHATRRVSLYATGATAAAGWTGKINGVTNPAKINGIAVGNIAKVNGI